jgi:putative Ca2+/H+ antiporter (TMEM165/GDT1 family)
VAHFPPVRPTAPGAIPDSVPGARRRPRRTWLALLLGAGAVILLAGLIWAIAAGKSRAGPSPAAQAGQQAQYRATGIKVAPRPRGAVVRWSPPSHAAGVVAFIVLAELGGRAQQAHTVGANGHQAVFAGLKAGRRYCFVVGTVVESAGGQAGTATAPDVCQVIR